MPENKNTPHPPQKQLQKSEEINNNLHTLFRCHLIFEKCVTIHLKKRLMLSRRMFCVRCTKFC